MHFLCCISCSCLFLLHYVSWIEMCWLKMTSIFLLSSHSISLALFFSSWFNIYTYGQAKIYKYQLFFFSRSNGAYAIAVDCACSHVFCNSADISYVGSKNSSRERNSFHRGWKTYFHSLLSVNWVWLRAITLKIRAEMVFVVIQMNTNVKYAWWYFNLAVENKEPNQLFIKCINSISGKYASIYCSRFLITNLTYVFRRNKSVILI